MTSDDMHLQALGNMATHYPLLKKINNDTLVKSTWHRLKPFSGAPEAIERLPNPIHGRGAHHFELGKHRQQFQNSLRSMGRHIVMRIFGLLQTVFAGLPESNTITGAETIRSHDGRRP